MYGTIYARTIVISDLADRFSSLLPLLLISM